MTVLFGPSGSGKSTTLYAALNAINSPDTKILTAENPVEYNLPGIIQTGKKQGMRLMDDTLIDLYDRGLISAEEAYARADQKQMMRQHLKM